MARLEQPGMQKLMPTDWTKDEVYSLEAGEEGTKYVHDQQKSQNELNPQKRELSPQEREAGVRRAPYTNKYKIR